MKSYARIAALTREENHLGIADRFNRIQATMIRLAEEGHDPVLAVRYHGKVEEFKVCLETQHLESTSGQHPRIILEAQETEFIEGYPSRYVHRTLCDLW